VKGVADFPEAPTVSRTRPAPTGVRRSCRRAAVSSACLVTIASACALGFAASAEAAAVSPDSAGPGGLVVADAFADEVNRMMVSAAPGYVSFQDTGHVLSTTAPQCLSVTPQVVRCDSLGLTYVTAQLGGGDDTFRLEQSVSIFTAVASASIDGGDGQDSLAAAVGVQTTLIGGTGDDELTGGTGPDTLFGGPGADTLNGGAGNDTIYGGDGTDVAYGGTGDDSLWGEIGGDLLEGDAGSDTLDGGLGDDSVAGGPGPDRLAGGSGVDLLDARDGLPDAVSCGGRLDLAIVDSIDAVRGCEEDHTDDGHRQSPELGESARATPVSGTVNLRLPGADRDRFYPLLDAANIPLRSALDASDGVVRVTTTKNRGGAVQDASFSRGKFSVDQPRTERPVTAFRLIGGSFAVCDGSGRSKASALVPLGHEGRAPIRIRRLRTVTGPLKGPYQVIGRYGIAVAEGTKWVTEDRCDGTVVVRETGRVLLRNRRRGGEVRAGNQRRRGAVEVRGRLGIASAEG
jgi:hypothetical protein